MVTSFKRSHAVTATLSASNPAAGQCQPTSLPETPGHSRASLGQSLVGSLLLSPGSWCTSFCLCPPRVYFPLLCKFWQLYAGVNGDLLQEGLYHTQVCSVQSPCPCGCLLLTCTSTENTQTQFCLSLCGVPGSWYAQDLFEPSERLCQEWSLILNVTLPPLLSCWGFFFALGCGVSPHGQSSEVQPTLLTLDVEYLLSASQHSVPGSLYPTWTQLPVLFVASHRGVSLAVLSQIFVILPYTFLY